MVVLGRTLILLALPLFALGCGGGAQTTDPETARRKGELTDVYEMYTMYIKKEGRPPQQASDLLTKKGETISPAGYRALKTGDVVAVWGVDINNQGSAVLAYVKDAPTKGGLVLKANGSIQTLSADELSAALPGKK